jgi:hypothetical protein
MMNADGDLLLHLNLGRYILNNGKVPLRDMFSHTMTGQPVIQHEWLSAVIFESVKRLFDFDGIIFLCAMVISTTIYLLYRFMRKRSTTLLPALLVSFLVLLTTMVHWLARPHIISFLLLVLWIITLEQLIEGKHHLWWALPALMLLWVNLHGGFIIGFITWLIYGFGLVWDILFNRVEYEDKLASNFWRFFLLGGITSFITSLINPSGINLWIKVVSHVGNRYLADVTKEFQSPNFHVTGFWPFLVMVGLLILVLGSSQKKAGSGRLFNSISWLLMALYSGRNIPLFAIVSAPLIAFHLETHFINANSDIKFLAWMKGVDGRLRNLDQKLKGFLWPLICILIVIAGLITGLRFDNDRQGYSLDPEEFPIEAVDWLEQHPQDGKMFNFFTWGGYLQYRLWPEKRVFIDSKSDFYGEEFVRKYHQVISQKDDWENVLDNYEVDWAILPTDEPVSEAIEEELGWKVVYEDDTAVILIRQ